MVYVASLSGGRGHGDVGRDPAQLLLDLDTAGPADFATINRMRTAVPSSALQDIDARPHPNASLRGIEAALGLRDGPVTDGPAADVWLAWATALHSVVVDSIPPPEGAEIRPIEFEPVRDPLHEFSVR